MARTKQTARKKPAKKKSGADKRRSPRLKQLAAKEPEDYDDEPAPEADSLVEIFRAGGGYNIDNTNRRQILYADHLALCCKPRCWLCCHCNAHLHAQADEFDDAGFVSLYEREHANINNNHVF